jgi:hypothetical protein
MKVITAVIVYDRKETIAKWLRAWNNAYHYGSELWVIHNHQGDHPPEDQKENILQYHPDVYVTRQNTGRDIGALQDTILGRLSTNTDWDVLCWFTDDFLPMQKDFLHPFIHKMQEDPQVGLVAACYEPQNESNKHGHVRTVGFSIRREVAQRLKWPADRIIASHECYEFEHGDNNMTAQVEQMGYKVVMAGGNVYPLPGYDHWPNRSHFMWDCSLLAHYNLWEKYEEQFNA